MSVYLALELADDRRLGAVAAEWDLDDAALDALEDQLRTAPEDQAASGALMLGRAGRSSSVEALRGLRARLSGPSARAIALAEDLLHLRPPKRLEQAESGYRWTDPSDEEVVFIEDDLAAHWHGLGRWGPPIRPWLDTPLVEVDEDADLERLLARAKEGRRLRLGFEREGLRRPPDLVLTRAGFGRDLDCGDLTRWPEVTSLGFIEGRRRRLAWSGADDRPHPLPARPRCGLEALEALFRRLRESA
jgi:hypothetical protein